MIKQQHTGASGQALGVISHPTQWSPSNCWLCSINLLKRLFSVAGNRAILNGHNPIGWVCKLLKGPVGEVKVVVAATAPVLGPYFTWAHNVTGSTMRTRSRCTYCKVLVTAVHGQCSLAGPLASTG
jgi:hypothetical protein